MRVNGTDMVISFTLAEALRLLHELNSIGDHRVTCSGNKLCEFRLMLDNALEVEKQWKTEAES